MSTESAKQFVKKMLDDKEFATKMEMLNSKDERASFIKHQGFDFTQQELTAAAAELNVADVVGGTCCGNTCERDGCPKKDYCNCDD